MSPVTPKSSAHILALDGLRGIAVLLVVVYHFTAGHISTSIGPSFHGIVSQFANVGWGGVDLFFVLSGFLITGILYDAKGAPHYFSNFWMRRVLRIFPLYYGVLVALFLIGPLIYSYSSTVRQHLNEQVWGWAYVLNFYYARPSHVLIDAFRLQHFWSLAIEEQFYLIWPFVIFFLRPKTAMWISAFCVGLALLLRVILVIDHYDPIVVWNLTPCRMDGVALGCLCALAIRNFKLEALWKAGRASIIFCGLGLIGILCWRRTWNWDDPAMESLGISLISFLCAGLLLMSIDPASKGLRWLLSCPLLTMFGVYSYAIYVFHFPLQKEFHRWFSVNRLSTDFHSRFLGLVIYVLCSTMVSLLVAMVSWHLYEKHFLKLKRYFSLTRKAEVPSQPKMSQVPTGHIRDAFRLWIDNLVRWGNQCPVKHTVPSIKPHHNDFTGS